MELNDNRNMDMICGVIMKRIVFISLRATSTSRGFNDSRLAIDDLSLSHRDIVEVAETPPTAALTAIIAHITLLIRLSSINVAHQLSKPFDYTSL
jgi:hypothetical protein